MAEGVFMDIEIDGTAMVAAGWAISVILEEDLDATSTVTARFVVDPDNVGVIRGLDFGDTVTVKLGDGDAVKRTITTTLVELNDEIDAAGGWSVSIRACDDLAKLKNKSQSKLHEGGLSALLSAIAGDHGLSAQPKGLASTTQPILQNNLSNAELLRRVAKAYRYTTTLDAKNLIFGGALDSTTVAVGVEDRLTRLSVRRSLLGIPTEVKVLGWDWKTNQATVTGQAAASQLAKISGGRDAATLVSQTWGTVTWTVEAEKVLVEGDATALATGVLRDAAERFLTGSLECLGQPDAKPGRTLTINDFAFANGSYRINATVHSVDPDQGYRTVIDFYSDSMPTRSL